MNLSHFKCLRCDHEWIPRREEHPRVCPKCKSPYWDRPRLGSTEEKKGGKQKK